MVREAHFPSGLLAAFASLVLVTSTGSAHSDPPTSALHPRDVHAHIAAREYWASPSDQGLQAPNRAHALRTFFGPDGIRVVDRTRAGGPALLALSVVSFGRPGSARPLPPGEMTSRAARVEVRRGSVIEWYVNGPSGLEQGFTLAEPPPGEGPVVVDLALQGATASASDTGAMIRSGTGRRLVYGGLRAADARGAELVVALQVPAADRIRLTVDDSGAAYPVMIDPLLTNSSDAQLESDQPAAQLGVSVSGAGDVNGDGYGDVIVGAPLYDAGQAKEGAAFIFLGGPSGLASGDPLTAHAQLESDQPSAQLGISVAGAGDVNGDGYADVIVGANKYDLGQTDEGAAFVFLGSAAGVASGDVSSAHARFEANQVAAQLGVSVAGAGDVNADGYADVIVGAPYIDAGQTDEGAAFVFEGSATGLTNGSPSTADAAIQANQAGALLGFSVAAAGDVDADGYADVILGAPLIDLGQIDEGAAVVFEGGAAGIASGDPTTADAVLQIDQAGAEFGRSVASAGDVDGNGYGDLIVGAPLTDIDQTDEGAAFVFTSFVSGIKPTPRTLEGSQANADWGRSVAGAGDVNRDGFDDVIVGAPLADANQADEGGALVYLGSGSGIATTPTYQLGLGQAGAGVGTSVASAGDVNASTYADVIVGAPLYDAGESDEGAAFVFLGGSWDPIAQPTVYHSPFDDGQPPWTDPPVVPPGTTLHLYVAEADPKAPSSAPGAVCQPLFEAWGSERCSWDLKVDVDGALTLQGFTPGAGVVAGPGSGTEVAMNGGSYAGGALGPEKLGDLALQGSSGTVWLRSGTVAGARLDRVSMTTKTVATVPEPRALLGLAAGVLLLTGLRTRRR